ncbi:MAG: VWA domain-containing protein [Planctomycetes bacterium]|nr:VWA domain-containing protein [Planctomycetota bacterium]
MPRSAETDITIILDRSGSMGSISTETIFGFNTFVDDQRRLPGTARLTLAQFDDQHEIVYDAVPLEEVPPLDHVRFQPRGATALLDAIGRSIRHTKTRLARQSDEEPPRQIICLIITDGQENASYEFDRRLVFDMIRTQRDGFGWQFVFLGANQDAIAEAGALGIPAGAAMTFNSSAAGARSAFQAISRGMASYRSMGLEQVESFFATDVLTDSRHRTPESDRQQG